MLRHVSSPPLSPPSFLTFHQKNARDILLCMFLNYRNHFLDHLQQVPCEQDFSSRKEASALQRNCINPKLLEALQVCKFLHKRNQLSFLDDLISREENDTISGQMLEAAELCKVGRINELHDLRWNSEDQQNRYLECFIVLL